MSDTRPANCRFRLQDEGKGYPRSSCAHCGKGIMTGLGTYCTFAPAPKTYTETEVRALVAAALQRALAACEGMDPAGDILALIDTDHTAALEAVKAQARSDAISEFCENLRLGPMLQADGMPEDVKRFRAGKVQP